MEIRQAQKQAGWDGWLKENNNHHEYLQSWAWGDILLEQGIRAERLQLVENIKIVGQAQLAYSNLPFGWKYAFCPKSFSWSRAVLKELVVYLKKQKIVFLRIEPKEKIECSNCQIKKTIDINPRATTILNLENFTEEDLLKKMKSKTRYNIRLAKRKGVKIKEEKDVNSFYKLSVKTAKRDGFKLHNIERYKAVLNSENSYQLNAYFENKLIASAIFFSFGDISTYLYGASDYKHRKLMAPHLLQWEGIKKAKEKKRKYYDFFGIAPAVGKSTKYNYDTKHQYAGVTRFKLGFGGEVVEQPGTFDIVLDNKKYLVYKVLRKIRRLF